MPYEPPRRTWLQKFADAARGMAAGMRCQASFAVHLPMAVAVVVLAALLRVSWIEACALVLCIAVVLAAELFNSALERLAQAITSEYSEDVRVGLNIASGAVLMAALGTAVVGLMIFVPHVVKWLW